MKEKLIFFSKFFTNQAEIHENLQFLLEKLGSSKIFLTRILITSILRSEFLHHLDENIKT